MSSRPAVEVTARVPADGGVSPNHYADEVTAHLRIYWPPLATPEQISSALAQAVIAAEQLINERRTSGGR